MHRRGFLFKCFYPEIIFLVNTKTTMGKLCLNSGATVTLNSQHLNRPKRELKVFAESFWTFTIHDAGLFKEKNKRG
jgi:hypothetical protein